jgi:hypothetical protein
MKSKIARLLWLAVLGAAPVASHADYVYTFSLDQAVSIDQGVNPPITYDAASFSFEAPTLPMLGSTFSVTPSANVNGAIITSVLVDGFGGTSWNFSTQPTPLTNTVGAVDFLAFTIDFGGPVSPGVYSTIFAGRCVQQTGGGCGVVDAQGSLTITPVPLPAAVWLMLSGLVVFGAMARREGWQRGE